MPSTMHSDRSAKYSLFRLKTLTAVVILALAAGGAGAVGLGKLTVLSGLGQPLNAEIDLTSVSPEEVATLAPKLASPEAFKQANIDLHPALLGLRFAVQQRGGRYFIRVTSSQPMNEPFVDMLLELGASNGRLMREYTFLLDPAELRTGQSAQVGTAGAPTAAAVQPAGTVRRDAPATAAVAQAQGAVPRATATAEAQSAAAASPAGAPARPSVGVPAAQPAVPYRPAAGAAATTAAAGTNANSGKQLQIRSGDTLAKVARENLPAGVSLDQMLVALYRANPDAFIGANMNRVRAGQILTVPDAGAMTATAPREARTVVLAQSADFNEYRNKLAGQVAGGPARAADASTQSASGKISSRVAEPVTAASEARDRLKLSRSRAAEDKSAPLAAAEDRIASEKALADSNARVRELERNVGDLQKLLEIKSRELAQRQKDAEADKTSPAIAAVTKPSDAAAPNSSAAVTAKSVPSSTPAGSVAATTSSGSTTAAPVPGITAPGSSATVPATSPVNTASPDAATATAPPKPAVVSKSAPAAPPPAESLFDNPLLLPGAGILLAALAALGLLAARRKRQTAVERDIAREPGLNTNSMFGGTGGRSVDTNNSEFNSSLAPTTGHLTGSEVDPIAEADVYIAYGRDAQAEEILKEALRANPDRHAVRLRLLEIYANRKDNISFEPLAAELQRMTGGKGEEWEQVAALSRILDPGAPPSSARTRYAKFATRVAPGNDELEGRSGTRHVEAPPSGRVDSVASDKAAVRDAAAAAAVPVALAAAAAAGAGAANAATASAVAPIKQAVTPAADDHTQMVRAPASVPVEALGSLDFSNERSGAHGIARSNDGPRNAAETIAETAGAAPAAVPVPIATRTTMQDIKFDFLDGPEITPEFGLETEAENAAAAVPSHAGSVETKPGVTGAVALDDEFALMEADFAKFEVPAKEGRPADAMAAPADFDLSDISLELSPQDTAPVTETLPAAPLEFDGLVFDSPTPQAASLPDVATSAEMSTKLDLAIAYEEIGDREGARELLEEVVSGGSPEQIARAQTLLQNLA